MDFNTVINNRKTNFTWTDQEVDKDKIKSIINNTLSKVPSKQKRMPYKIDVFDYSDKELRKEIFLHTKRDSKLTDEQDSYNPQTLAPILLVFSMRNGVQALAKLNKRITEADKYGYKKNKRVIKYI